MPGRVMITRNRLRKQALARPTAQTIARPNSLFGRDDTTHHGQQALVPTRDHV